MSVARKDILDVWKSLPKGTVNNEVDQNLLLKEGLEIIEEKCSAGGCYPDKCGIKTICHLIMCIELKAKPNIK